MFNTLWTVRLGICSIDCELLTADCELWTDSDKIKFHEKGAKQKAYIKI